MNRQWSTALTGQATLKRQAASPRWALALVLVAVVLPVGVGAAGKKAGETIKVLQWNPHWECFVQSEDCKTNARSMLDNWLNQDDLDFASLIMFQDSNYTPPAGWNSSHVYCGLDVVQLYWRMSRWEALTQPGAEEPGCLEPEDRPFVVQAFREKTTDLRAVIAAAHFPHPGEIEIGTDVLRDSIKNVMAATGISNVAIVADTNQRVADRYGDATTLMQRLEMPNADSTIGTTPVGTCCLNNNYSFSFDRVISNFGQDMHTSTLLSKNPKSTPWAVGTFHLPLVGVWTAVDNKAALYKTRDFL